MGRLSREQASMLSSQNRAYRETVRKREPEFFGVIASHNKNTQFRHTLRTHVVQEGIDKQKEESDSQDQQSWDRLKQAMNTRIDSMTAKDLEDFSRQYEYLIDDVFRYSGDGQNRERNWTDAQEKMLSLASQLGIRYNRYFDSEEQKQRNRENSARYRQEQMTFYAQQDYSEYDYEDE